MIKCLMCGTEIHNRYFSSLNPNGHNFCNHRCAATFTNKYRITKLSAAKQKRRKLKPVCANLKCNKQIDIENKIYCSSRCRFEVQNDKSKNLVILEIKKFVKKYGRIPIKYELPTLSSRGRHCFGTWNKAISAAGFIPNEVIFSKKFTANDGHICDSLSEKVVDDWLSARKIKHQIHVKYPWKNGMSADFKVGKFWIELFGLTSQLKRYDLLMSLKLELISIHRLKLTPLYLSDIFPVNKLHQKLGFLMTSKKARL